MSEIILRLKRMSWVLSLPLGVAARIILMKLCRRVSKLPVFFSFAQGAEDILISHIFSYHSPKTGPGFYVDVGCNAPIRYSNTFDLYLRGWRGICIDANSRIIDEFRRVRKRDVAICAAVSDSENEVTLYKSTEDAVSTIDEQRIVEWKKHFEFPEAFQERMVTQTLTSLLDRCPNVPDEIDLLSIDVEGHDYKVLLGLDFDRYRPTVIVIEMHNFEFESIEKSEVYRLLVKKNYRLLYFAVLNAYFIDSKKLRRA